MSRIKSQLVFSDLTGGINNVDTKENLNSTPKKTQTPDMVNVEYFQLGGIKTMDGNVAIGDQQTSPVIGGWEYTKGNNRYMLIGLKNGQVKQYNPATEIPQSDAKGKEIGDHVEEKFKVTSFGRVASQTAKQVVIQRLREAERDAVLAMFEDKIGTVMNGTVVRVEPRVVRIDLGKATGIMPKSEQIDGEYYTVGSRLKVYIKEIERNERGAQLILSRGCTQFIEYLFRQEVPEIENGSVEIKAIAREAGRRTKIAVAATMPGIDPVGTFVGGRGVRVQAVMNEIGDREKIDIVNWSDNNSEYIREALSPAEIQKVEIDGKKATVYVAKDQQSIAIGRIGQNVRLASELTGFDIDVEVAKAPEKKKKKNVEDSLLSAVEEADEDAE